MREKIIWIAVIIIFLVCAGVYFWLSRDKTSPLPSPGQITISGEITCLPKTGSGPQTLECATGLKGTDGRYYGLKNLSEFDPEYKFSIIGTKVKVSGVFSLEKIKSPDGNEYDIAGVIVLDSIDEIENKNGGAVGEFWGTVLGTVVMGPNCPVQDPTDPNCTDKPYKTRLVLTTKDGSKVIKEFSSDANGKFSIEVPPGEYAIRSAAAANVLPYCQSDGVIVLEPNGYIETTVRCDTGIR